ncbi:MAG: 16S rRNA (uracil(1498)-N(3))-methyltransferase [Planctomycetes bacterium]|nr:16S rRNA (uracil(1498)-N(3))-methyltransferase [Planctomycetota bacterium]
MRVPRVHGVDLPREVAAAYRLEGPEAVHLGRVLRVAPGDEVEVFDADGGAGRFRVVDVGRGRVDLVLDARVDVDRELPFRLTCAVAPPKGKRAQRLVEELTELGAAALAPLLLRRTAARPPEADEVRRWSLEAAKQCLRNRALAPLPPLDLAGLVALGREHALALLPDTVDARPLREALDRPRPASVLVAVGPEGGFAPEEREALRAAGFQAASLGSTVLRIETAAAAVTAALVAAWA